MKTNLRLKNPTCRAYVFERLLSYVFNQINTYIMVLIETVGQKKNPRLRDLVGKNSRIRDAKKHKTRFRDSFKTPEFSRYHSPLLQLVISVILLLLKYNFYLRNIL